MVFPMRFFLFCYVKLNLWYFGGWIGGSIFVYQGDLRSTVGSINDGI
jgi:hypothetical protein